MTSDQITNRQARRFMLLKHGLLGERRFAGDEGAYAFIRQAGSIQFDPIDICGRNADLVLQSRVSNYSKQVLNGLLYEQRRLVDYFDKELCIFPVEDWPRFFYMRQIRGGWMRSHEQIASATQAVVEEIGKHGPMCSKDFDSGDKVRWFWGSSRLPRAVLEHLYYAGALGIHHKRGVIKYYDLIERCLPQSVLQEPSGFESGSQLHEFLLTRRIGAVGLLWNKASSAWLGFPDFKAQQRREAFNSLAKAEIIRPLRVEGMRDLLYMLAEDDPLMEMAKSQLEYEPRCELIAPLDNIMWDRKLIEAVFGFTYTWEIYVPQEKRKYGYYVLPVLMGERFAGRIEPVANKKTGGLQIKGLWFEDRVDKDDPCQKALLDDCLARFARFHQQSSM